MIQPGEIEMADTEAGKRSAVIVSRKELNRGNWIVVVLLTSTHFSIRSTLSHCVPFHARELGLTKDCVAPAEAITYVPVSDPDIDAGVVVVLDESRLRDLILALGNMMASGCEPE